MPTQTVKGSSGSLTSGSYAGCLMLTYPGESRKRSGSRLLFQVMGAFKQMLNPLWMALYAFSSSPKDLLKARSIQRRGKISVLMKRSFK